MASRFEDAHTQDVIEAKRAGFCSAFLLPVRRNDEGIAVLEFFSNHSQIQDRTLLNLLDAVGDQIGTFLEHKLLEEALAIRASQQELLAQAGMALSTSLDFQERLEVIVKVIVPDLADWFAIDMIDGNNTLSRVAAAHVDPAKEHLVYQLQPTRQLDPAKRIIRKWRRFQPVNRCSLQTYPIP